jgi:hypothetical protein
MCSSTYAVEELIPEAPRDKNRRMHGSFREVCGEKLPNLFGKKPEAKRPDDKPKQSKRDVLWDAAMKVMQPYKIAHADKEEGVIRTEEVTVDAFDPTGAHTYVITATVTETGVTATVTSSTDTKEHCAEFARKIRQDVMDEQTA